MNILKKENDLVRWRDGRGGEERAMQMRERSVMLACLWLLINYLLQ